LKDELRGELENERELDRLKILNLRNGGNFNFLDNDSQYGNLEIRQPHPSYNYVRNPQFYNNFFHPPKFRNNDAHDV
jgi:guanyl-specific ribonuclease Sa